MSLYAVSLALGYMVGPLAATKIVPIAGTSATFLAAGGLAIAAAIVLLRLDPDAPSAHAAPGEAGTPDAAPGEAKAGEATPAMRVLWRIKIPCLATFSYGYFQASVVLFLPLFLIQDKGIPAERTILITAFFAAGMLTLSTIVSRIGDRTGHLRVMGVLAAVGGAMVAGFVLLSSFRLMCAAVFVAGATLASISPLSLALQGVVISKRDLSRANAFYNAFYAAGMLVGPLISGVLFERRGGAVMLWHLAGLWACFVATTIVFASDDPRAVRAR
jgi:predicted MFS family arabinose efflux permease